MASPVRADALLAAVVFAAFAIEAATSAHRQGGVLVNGALIALAVGPLAVRRRAPLPACVAVFAGLFALDLVATPVAPLVTPVVLVGLVPYTLGAHLPLRPALAGIAVALLLGGLLELTGPDGNSIGALAAVELLAWAAGRWVRTQDQDLASAGERARQLSAERDAAAQLAVLRERTRTACELHDVTAHAMTAVVLQAGAAQRVWDTDPGAARGAVDAVGRLAAGALDHLTGADAVLDLAALAAQARANGLVVSLAIDAPPAPAVIEAAAYRTVQEALTNAARHAAGAAVDVRLRADAGALLVEVVDDGGHSADVNGSGHGLRGMRERVEACGGRLEYGPTRARGWMVRATLPL